MPRNQPEPPSGGTFTDLYDAMQQKRSPSSRNGTTPAEPPVEPSSTPSANESPQAIPVPKSTRASSPAHAPASKRASVLADSDEQLIASIRRTVRATGKEVVYVRLTPSEKAQLADIVYTYKRLGQRTTDTEVGRIAVNYIIQDYTNNGENSILARVLASLLE